MKQQRTSCASYLPNGKGWKWAREHLKEKAQRKEALEKIESRMDPESAKRYLMEFVENSSSRSNYINLYLVLGAQPPGILEHERGMILSALNKIPTHRLDEKISMNLTVRQLIIKVSEIALSKELRQACLDKLKSS